MAAQNTILPNIQKVVLDKNISRFTTVPGRPDELRIKCPFCPGGDNGNHLYINTEKNSYRCFRCGDRGGILRFIARLENRSESDVLEEILAQHREGRNYHPRGDNRHPAEKLNTYQLRELGYLNKLDWLSLKKQNPGYARRCLDNIWNEWTTKLKYEVRCSVRWIYLLSKEGNYTQAVADIKRRGLELNHDLLTPALKILSIPDPPEWVIAEKLWLKEIEEYTQNNGGNDQIKQLQALVS